MLTQTEEKQSTEGGDNELMRERARMLARLNDIAAQQKMVLFEGDWVSPEKATSVFRRMKWRGRWMILEILLLYLIMLGATYFTYIIFIL